MKASYDTSENYNTVMEIVTERGMTAEDVLNALTDWHGLQILDEEFTENFIEEYGY